MGSREPALACAYADHAAGGGCGQRMRLLEALVVHVLPDMSPGGKSSGNVRLDGQHDHARAEATGAHKADGGEIARTQVRDEMCIRDRAIPAAATAAAVTVTNNSCRDRESAAESAVCRRSASFPRRKVRQRASQ